MANFALFDFTWIVKHWKPLFLTTLLITTLAAICIACRSTPALKAPQAAEASKTAISREINVDEHPFQKVQAPYEAEFQTWLDQYLKDNPNSWLKGKSVELYLVPMETVGKEPTAHVIAKREHCYLTLTYKGRAVLAVLNK